MDWLTEIIKQLQTSRAFVTGVFIVCLCILLGNKFVPSLIPKVPADWRLPLIGGLLFSGTLLAFIILSYIWLLFSEWVKRITKILKSLYLSNDEQRLLNSLALTIEDNINNSVNLSDLDYSSTNFSKLEFQEIVINLEKKGLIELNPYNHNLITLSDSGRKLILKMRRKQG